MDTVRSVMPHPGDIYAGHGDNLIQALKRLFRFQQEDDANLLIHFGEDVGTSSLIEIVGYAQGDAPPAERRILELADDVFGLLPRFHTRHHHTPGADVQNARQRRVCRIRDSGNGNNVVAAAQSNHLGEQGNIAPAVFHIENYKIKATCREHGSNAGGKEFKDHLSQKNFTLLEPLAKHGHSASPFAAYAALYFANFSRKVGVLSTFGLTTCSGTSPR